MTTYHKTALRLAQIALLLFVCINCSALPAQPNYLEFVGGSEIELKMAMEPAGTDGVTKMQGSQYLVESKDANVTYTLREGRVTDVSLNQFFNDLVAAEKAFEKAKSYLQARGLGMNAERYRGTHKVYSGSGNGYSSTMTCTPENGRYRLDISFSMIN